MLRGALAVGLAALAFAAPAARAFDTGPHADLTRDSLGAEGFSGAAGDIGAVDNWLVDYYTNPDKNPYSGHASALIGVTRLGLAREDWLWQWVAGARHMHFDSERRQVEMPDLQTIDGIEQEWRRLRYITQKMLRSSARMEDPYRVLAVMGSSLHAVQDFYAHSNWVEPYSDEVGRGGPGVADLGYGDHPTFFDIPPEVRHTLYDKHGVYTGVKGVPRQHGHWQSNDNHNLHDGLNKDWPGRPLYDDAYITAYFASRQWIQAMHTWLGNEPLWKRAQAMVHTSALAHDVEGAEQISVHSGHWQGGGEPCVPFSCGVRTGKAGSVVSLRLAIGAYHDRGPTRYRRAFNDIIGGWMEYPKTALPEAADIPSSRAPQLFTRFVKFQVLNYNSIELGDPVGGADIYTRARIAGQPYASTVINGKDSFHFQGTYAPFEWMRAVPSDNRRSEPVTSMTVRIETGRKSGAGTDDDVYLRINPSLRFDLGKRAYDDFEKGDDDTYSVPIGAATKAGLTVGDIDRVVIEKSRDGVAGGWFLHGVTLTVNGRVLMRNRAIDRWLEDNHRSWVAPAFARDTRTDNVVPVWIQMLDDDFGANDTGDINPFDRMTAFPIAYRVGTVVQAAAVHGARLSGRLSQDNGDSARLTYRLTTLDVKAPPLPGQGPPPAPTPTASPTPSVTATPGPGPKPDLVLTAFDANSFTVKNQGPGDAGAFTVTVTSGAQTYADVRFDGLAAGASDTRSWTVGGCENVYTARADSQGEVGESDETNNERTFSFAFC